MTEEKKAKLRAYYHANKERINARRKNPEYRAQLCAYQKEYYQKNKDLVKSRVRRATYGILPKDFDALYAKQNGNCAICSKQLLKKPYLDHCHKTGKIRGLLCLKCNSGLGFFKDSKANIKAALAYLERADE